LADHDILKEMVEKMSQGRGQDPEKRTGEEAEADDTVDNREDVQVERQDGEEETPSPERGQRN
jgi:hypothetical protein